MLPALDWAQVSLNRQHDQAAATAQRAVARLAFAGTRVSFFRSSEAIVAMAAYFFVLHGGGWHWGESLEANDSLYLQATTACFSAIIVTQIVNVFLCKNAGAQPVQRAIVRQSALSSGVSPLKSHWFWLLIIPIGEI